MLALKMQQMLRYAFIVRVVGCSVHKVCIIYVQAVIYILARIQKKNRKHTIKASANRRRFRTDEGQETRKQNARRLKEAQHLWQSTQRQNVPSLLHLRDITPKRQPSATAECSTETEHGFEFDIRQQISPITDSLSSQKPMK
jgi:hypothetical protein